MAGFVSKRAVQMNSNVGYYRSISFSLSKYTVCYRNPEIFRSYKPNIKIYTQVQCVYGLSPLPGIRNARKHNVSVSR
jgi:hypothetical protein